MELPVVIAANGSLDLENEIARFWALAGISAKKIARGHPWSAIAILGYLRASVNKISWLAGVSDTAPSHADARSDPPLPILWVNLPHLVR